ncbi:CheA signal transduction histidine kinase [Caballeronia catudaia]|uniref:CheA signal transduction histidine kinase n=1 Tax=Caballeronia catudaia TaxID=1777136 RepID=A0A158A0B5_9BURK|nr:hypothetical protein [Caballeronia catudaia]SAK51190.1 CheA signal transduction histidine kinase [Caballeronia catudaia]
MNKTTLQLACAVLFCAAQLAHADTAANASSGSVSGSTSTGIGQGGGSSLNNIGTSANSTANTSSNSSSVGGLGVANANGGRSSATGGSSSARGGSSNVNISLTMPALANSSTGANGTGSPTGTDATGKAATSGPGTSAFDTRTTVDYNQSSYSVRTTPAIAAPALTTTLSDTCMGSASFGLSITGFGATGGTTLVDQACVRRLDAREFRAMGLTDVALALLCQSEANRRAVEATGHLCPGTTTPLVKSGADAVLSDDEKFRDPLIRARLGLPVTAANNPEVSLKTRDDAKQAQPAPAKQVAQPTPVAARAYDKHEASDGVEVASAPIGEKIEVSLVQ